MFKLNISAGMDFASISCKFGVVMWLPGTNGRSYSVDILSSFWEFGWACGPQAVFVCNSYCVHWPSVNAVVSFLTLQNYLCVLYCVILHHFEESVRHCIVEFVNTNWNTDCSSIQNIYRFTCRIIHRTLITIVYFQISGVLPCKKFTTLWCQSVNVHLLPFPSLKKE